MSLADMAVVLQRKSPTLSKLNVKVKISEFILVKDKLWLIDVPIQHKLIK